ncbi:MAG: ATP synthase F1 subunit epsilon [Alphaproteobacteria bacterium]|nr:ATP synthase F1 subunit epsilon [Alphaproteobacteria bacterium]
MADATQKMIQFELVSPERRLVSEPVTMAVIPGTEGQIGVLAGHSALVASLKVGVVELHVEGQDVRRIFIAGGFADVTQEQCTVLAEEAINISDLDQEALTQKAADLSEDLGLAKEAVDKARVLKHLTLVNAKLEAIAA